MPDILALKERRNRLVAEARSLIETAEAEDRDFNDGEKRDWDRVRSEIESMDRRIERQEAEDERDRQAAPTPRGPAGDGIGWPETELADQFRALATGEQRNVTVNFTGADTRDLVVGTDTAGGHTVPTSFVRRLYEFMTETSAMRQANPTVLTTNSGEPLQVPKLTGHGSAGWVGSEGGAIPESDPTFGQVELNAHKAGQFIQLSSELIQDTAVNLLDFIARDAGRALGELTGAAYVNGSGTGQPTGYLPSITVGVNLGSSTAVGSITAQSIRDLFFSVIQPYRTNAVWMMNDSTMAEIAALQDGSGQYIVQPDLTTGVPARLMGKPITVDPNMPNTDAVDNRAIAFGDFSAYYIRDVGQMRFERSQDFAFNTDLVSFRSILRTDGELVDTTGAIKALAV